MRRECRERFPRHCGLAIPTCITARAWCTCRDACRDRYLAISLEFGGGKTFPAFPAHVQPAILCILQEAHDRHPLPCVCLREPGRRDVITDNGATSNDMLPKNIYLHDVPECLLVKTVQYRQDYLSRWLIKFRKQYNTKTDPQTDDVWRILWRQREREAVATRFSRRPYATLEWRWIWHASKIYGITAFTLNGLHRNMPVFLEDNFLILEHKVSFGFFPYPSSVLIYKKSSTGKTAFHCPTVAPAIFFYLSAQQKSKWKQKIYAYKSLLYEPMHFLLDVCQLYVVWHQGLSSGCNYWFDTFLGPENDIHGVGPPIAKPWQNGVMALKRFMHYCLFARRIHRTLH